MIAPLNMPTILLHVPQSGRSVMRLTDSLRDAAAAELDAVLDGVSCKQVRRANVDGVGVTYLSRAKQGDSCNPLFRIAAVFVLMKRLGLGREGAQRMVDWLQALVDAIWPTGEAPEFEETMQEEQELDAADDPCQMRAVCGDADALREFIAVKRRQRAFDRVVIQASERQLALLTGGN